MRLPLLRRRELTRVLAFDSAPCLARLAGAMPAAGATGGWEDRRGPNAEARG
jgi:hypothetical protein